VGALLPSCSKLASREQVQASAARGAKSDSSASLERWLFGGRGVVAAPLSTGPLSEFDESNSSEGPTRAETVLPKGSEPRGLPLLDTSGFDFGVPSPLPQALACGERTLVRLLAKGFVSYQLSTWERRVVSKDEYFRSATALLGFSTLLLGALSTQRYYMGERSAERFARTAALGPFSVFPDNDAKDRYWVHGIQRCWGFT
jgi:hypothetical protein